MSPDNVQAEWTRLWIVSLADAGVDQVVISPGSRSTPLVLAALAEPRMAVADVLDERAAGYFALGYARITGRPALLICTSGTAGANYTPAVIEARHAFLPLLVVTADRPAELAHCGANQTIDQTRIFGHQARASFDLGMATEGVLALRALRRTAAQAVLATRYPEPGAVHCNLRLRKPLEPPVESPGVNSDHRGKVDAVLARPIAQSSIPAQVPHQADVEKIATACREIDKGLVVCGPADVSQAAYGDLVADLGRRTGFPIYADPASQLRRRSLEGSGVTWVDSLDALAHSSVFRRRMAPGLILQVGRAPTSGAWDRYLGELVESQPELIHWVLCPNGWQDPQSSASGHLLGDLDPALRSLLQSLPEAPEQTSWALAWSHAEIAAREIKEEELATEKELSEGAVARAVMESWPEGGLLVIGNSLPIRQLDTWGGRGDVLVASQRGTSGIEGLVAGAVGAAQAHGQPTVLVVGDVSFLHDLSGLVTVGGLETPLAIVVVQNGGGRIFEQLPVHGHPAAEGAFQHWTTPHGADLSGAAKIYGLPFERADSKADLTRALSRAQTRRGATLLEAVVPASGALERNQSLWQRLERWEQLHEAS